MTTKKNNQKAERAKGKIKSDTSDLLKRPFLISIGALVLAEEQTSNFINSLKEKSEKAQKAGEKYIKKLNKDASKALEKAKKNGKKRQDKEDWVLRTLNWLSVPTRNDIEKLNRKVDALMKKVA
jgi:poly(hydroxyalkanoate) granule-associated protein